MTHLIQRILESRGAEVVALIKEKLEALKDSKLQALKETISLPVMEANVIKQGRVQLIRRRIRKNKIQRNIRKSAVKGFTLRRGKLSRIPASRRIRMRIVQRRAARKRKMHLQSSLRKRRISLRKRKSIGL